MMFYVQLLNQVENFIINGKAKVDNSGKFLPVHDLRNSKFRARVDCGIHSSLFRCRQVTLNCSETSVVALFDSPQPVMIIYGT